MRAVVLTALIAILLDQATKWAVIHGMELARIRSIDVLPPLLNFRYGENHGINFGLFSGGVAPWVLIVLALAICLAVLIWIMRRRQSLICRIGAGLLIGGALGNVIDRVFYGYVLDFLNMSCCGIRNPFVFNVADVFILAGAIGLAFFADDPTARKKQT